jgi:hypothetical protein
MRRPGEGRLLDAAAVVRSRIGGVLPDIGGFALLCRIVHPGPGRRVFLDLRLPPTPLLVRLAGGTGGISLWRDMATPPVEIADCNHGDRGY